MVEVAAIVLAAGRATRFSAGLEPGSSKVFAELGGRSLVAHAAAAAAASQATPVIVVTGRDAERAATAFVGLEVALVHNSRFAEGMAGSIAVGIAAVPDSAEAAIFLLGDMPMVAPATLDALITAFDRERPDAVAPVHAGRRGNPVLISRQLFPRLLRLSGDEGARQILSDRSCRVLSFPVDDPGVHVDVDTREALEALARQRTLFRAET